MPTDKQRRQVELLVAQYAEQLGIEAAKLTDLLLLKIRSGMTVDKAINAVFKETGFFVANRESTASVIVKAAFTGAGVALTSKTDSSQIRSKLLNKSWTPDKMTLSQRLHGLSARTRQEIVDTTAAAMRQGKNVIGIARDLYDGYNAGKVVSTAELPEYLKRLQKAAIRAVEGDQAVFAGFVHL